MNSIFEKILSCYERFVFYGTIKIMVVLPLSLIPFVRPYVNSNMSFSELLALMQNEQLIGIILLRELCVELSAYVSYVLFQVLLSDNPKDFILDFSMYTVMKFVLKQLLVYALKNNVRIHECVDPHRIKTALSYAQIDSIEFARSPTNIVFGIVRGMFIEMFNYRNVFTHLRQWYRAGKKPNVYATIV